MSSQSSKYRRKLKQENPEAYRIYLDKQKLKSKENRDRLKQKLKENPTDEFKAKRQRQLDLARERKRRWSERQKKGKETKRRKKRTSTKSQEDARHEDCEDQDDIATNSMGHSGNSTDDAGEKSGSEICNERPNFDQDDSFASSEKNNNDTAESEAWNSRQDFNVPASEIDTTLTNAQQANPSESQSSLRSLSPESQITSKENRREGDMIMHDTIQLHRTSLTILDQPYTMTSGPGHDTSNIASTSLNGPSRIVTRDDTRDVDLFSQQANQDQTRSSGDNRDDSLEYEAMVSRHEPYSLFIQENTENISHRQRDPNDTLHPTQSPFQHNGPITGSVNDDPVVFNSNIPFQSRLPLPLNTGTMLFRPTVLTHMGNRNLVNNNSTEGIIRQSTSVPDIDHRDRAFQSRVNLYSDINQWPGLDNDPNALPMTSSVFGMQQSQRFPVLLDGRGMVPLDFQQNQIPLTFDLNMLPVNGNSLSETLQLSPDVLNPVDLSSKESQRNNNNIPLIPSNSHPTPYTRFINQQDAQSSNSIIERQRTSTCQYHREPANIACIDCDRKLVCGLCTPNHYRHRFTPFKMLKDAIVRTDEVEIPSGFVVIRMFTVGESLYFLRLCQKTLLCYNIISKKMSTINLTCDYGDSIYDICLSSDREQFWYCTEKGSVYQMSVRDESCVLKFTCDINHFNEYYRRMCVTRGNRVLLYVQTRGYLDEQDDSDTSDTDSDEGDTECCYIMVYTTDGQLQSRRLIERKTDVYIDCIRECSITGDLLIVIDDLKIKRSKLLLTDQKLCKKYEISGKTVRYHTGGRKKKRTGYSRSWSYIDDACFDAEGNILLSLHNCDVILMDHDTGKYIRTVFTPDYWCVITVQEDGVLCCCETYHYEEGERKLTSVKYLEKL